MMPLQRACDAEKQVRNKLSNGPLRVQSNVRCAQSILQREGIRQLSGICWYPAKGTGFPVKSRWHRGCNLFDEFVLDREQFLSRTFLLL